MVTKQSTSDAPTPGNVVAALARVTAEIGGIEKRRKNDGGGGGVNYAFRGIDAIAAAAQPLFGQYGIVMVPEVVSQDIVDITVANKPWTDTHVEVQWSIYGPGGVDDQIVAVTRGWGRDNSDKGANKAMTQAFKNLLLRVLCIGDPADDTDGDTHEAQYGPPPTQPTVEAIATYDRMRTIDPESPLRAVLRGLATEHGQKLTAVAFTEDPEWHRVVQDALEALDDAEHIAHPEPATADDQRPFTDDD
jgi:hypothetical protein